MPPPHFRLVSPYLVCSSDGTGPWLRLRQFMITLPTKFSKGSRLLKFAGDFPHLGRKTQKSFSAMTYSEEYTYPFALVSNEFDILSCCEKKHKTFHGSSEERDALLVFTAEVF